MEKRSSTSACTIPILSQGAALPLGVKEEIYIRVAESSLNKDGGHYLLAAVWTNLLRARVQLPPRS